MNNLNAQELEKVIQEKIECTGAIVLVKEMTEDKVVVRLEGECSGCPGLETTFKDVVEDIIKQIIPTVQEVILDTSYSEEMLDFARKLLSKNK